MELVSSLSFLFAVATVLGAAALSLVILAGIWWRDQSGQGLIQVVVLGDAGRSPRMQYHCLSLVQQQYTVDLIGYGGSPLIKELRESQRLTHHQLPEPPVFSKSTPKILRYGLKVLYQMLTLFWVIFIKTKKPSHILLQTPPAIPSLFVVIVASFLRGSKLIVDYHNYGHTILALSLGRNHLLVKIAKIYEWLLAGYAHANLCVSEAMKKDLRTTLGIHSIILYDRPPGMFRPTSIADQHKLFEKLAQTEPGFKPLRNSNESESSTLFTEVTEDGKIQLRKDRPFLVISSTSWTEDEDFSILLKALEGYDEKASENDEHSLPNMMCVITGKGPLKEHYKEVISKKKFNHVTVSTPWLEIEDYPVLLGSADLGVCLHKSSSGLDLPMKVVDMFGSGIPVCAINFNCLHELLRHQHNGLIFNDHSELAEQLKGLSKSFPETNQQLQRFRDNLSSFQSLRWDHYWKLHVFPLIVAQ